MRDTIGYIAKVVINQGSLSLKARDKSQILGKVSLR